MEDLAIWLIQRPFVPLVLFCKWLKYLFIRRPSEIKRVIVFPRAMHLLEDGLPGDVFARRIAEAVKIYRQDPERTAILVTGSRHRDGERVDSIPLWLAANKYLQTLEVPVTAIIVDNSTCFNGQTEILLAARLFHDFELHGETKLIIISAHYVWLRTILGCVWLGIKPEFIWLKEKTTWRTWAFEAIVCLYSFFDPDWQSPNSIMGRLTRKSREVRE